MRSLTLLVAGFILGTIISTASAALFESKTNDARPIVGYGKNGTSIVAILVDSNGVLQTN